MMKSKKSNIVRTLITLFLFLFLIEMSTPPVAEGRAGGGRSSGRSSFGGGGGRRYSAPPSQQPYRSAPGPDNRPMPSQGGGFMRGLAGGIAGGFLGSMLFGSLGHAAGMGGGGGGIGFLEILLMAGLAFMGFRWWQSRHQKTRPQNVAPEMQSNVYSGNFAQPKIVSETPMMDPDEASDIFFKIQGAWTRRDLSSVKPLLGGDMPMVLNNDLDALKREQKINRLENITVRGTQITEQWHEGDADFVTARFTANLLDYTVDEKTLKVVEGSDTMPVKFEEDWIFSKSNRNPSWQLVGIEQV